MTPHQLLLLAALAATAAPIPKDDASGLRWKFEKGRTFYQEQTTHTEQTMNVTGSDVRLTQTQTFVRSWTPEKQDGDRWVLRYKVEAAKMEVDIGGSKLHYDSTKAGNDKGPLQTFFDALVGSELLVTVEKGSRVVKVEGREALLKKVADANKETEALLRQLLSEDAVMQMANPMLVTPPRPDVGKGDYWVKEERIDMGGVGAWAGRWQYSHAGKDGKFIKLKSEAIKFEHQAPVVAAEGLPFRLVENDLKAKKSSGTILFDPEKGRLESAEMVMEIEGALTVTVGAQETKVRLSQTQKTTTKTHDSNPLKK